MSNTTPNDQETTSESNSIEPIMQFCVFCDAIAKGPGNKSSFIGVFDRFSLPGVISIPQFFIAVRWVNGLGTHTSTMRLLDPDLNVIHTPTKVHTMNLTHRANAANAHYGIVNLKFSTPGVHWVEILLNDEVYTAIPLPVFIA